MQKVFALISTMLVAILFCLYFSPEAVRIDNRTLYICIFLIAVAHCACLDKRMGAAVFILGVVYILFASNRESIVNNAPDLDAEIVVARYKESLDWLGKSPYSGFNHIIYNKGPNTDFYTSDKTTAVVNLPNVGKCDHTYLYHIVENYDKLKDITIFLPGSVDMGFKNENATRIINSLYSKQTSTIIGHAKNNVQMDMWDFTLDNWKTTDAVNHDDTVPDTTELAKIRPFGEWYRHHFGDLHITLYSPFGIMAISRKHIHNHPKSYYENLISELDKSPNPEVGHFFERAWVAVFHPMDGLVAL